MTYFESNFLKLLFLIFTPFLFTNCNNSYVDDVDRSSGYKYKPGFPELRMVASSFITPEDESFIVISSEAVYGSFIYKKEDGKLTATGEFEYIIKESEKNQTVASKISPLSVSDESDKYIYSQNTLREEERFKVEPGKEYIVVVTLQDLNSQKSISRETQVFVPDPKTEESNITKISILSKNESEDIEFKPITTYDIQNDHDSLKFVFQVTNNSDENLVLNSRLIKFEADTSIALPMNFTNYSTSSIQYRGIDYSRYDLINSSRRVITTQGNVSIEFRFPSLKRGNYRFEITSNKGTESELFKAREFSIKSKNYPSISTARELAKPLYYLMSEKEYKTLMAIEDDKELKKKIDQFWLSNINNSRKARQVIEIFYQRVEEANKQFSNYKEGWKTDQGMIYILFGPPWYVDSSLNNSVWRYSYNAGDPEKNFLFTSPKIQNKYFPFDNFILQRTTQYYNIQYQQIQLWLSGLILQRSI